MIEVKGFKVTANPFSDLNLVGILLYHDFPSTVVYSNNQREPVIVEWVDCSDHRQIHRYLVYKSSVKDLSNYVNGKLSHLQLIKSAVDGLILSYDKTDDSIDNLTIVPFSQIPPSYLPKKDVYFDSNEEVELDEVTIFFGIQLRTQEATKNIPGEMIRHISQDFITYSDTKDLAKLIQYDQKDLLRVVAENQNSEIVNLHIKEGDKIGYGTADTFVLGRLLTTIDDLYRETALDHEEGIDRDNLKSINSKRGQSLYPKISTRVVLNNAASYSVFIKPIENAGNTENSILKKVFALFRNSNDKIALLSAKKDFSSYVYKSYQEFLEVIKNSNVDLDCNFYDPFKKQSIDEEFEFTKAANYLENIKHLTTKDTEKLKLKIRFKALNCNTGHYTLKLDTNEELKGHFDPMIKSSMPSLTFTNYYDVTINREKINISGSSKIKLQDIIISCIKSDN